MSNSKFFQKFPLISYNGKQMRNIALGTRIIKEVLDTPQAVYSYTIRDGERPDTIAYDYYGDSELFWLVLLSNSIIDPYYQWPLTQSEFISYILNKYGTIETAQGTILYWSNPNYNYYMTNESHSLLASGDKEGWTTPVYAFDYEQTINESRRTIKLIDRKYVSQILSELGTVFI